MIPFHQLFNTKKKKDDTENMRNPIPSAEVLPKEATKAPENPHRAASLWPTLYRESDNKCIQF